MADGVLLLSAAADSIRAYGEFPLIGARGAVWIAAEVHLMFAAFVLGVPMFAVVAEAIGIFGKEARYDRLAKEFTRLLLVAYSATAIWGAILVFLLSTLYMRPWAYLTAVFGPSMWAYAGLFLFESFTLYLYYYGWDRWKYGGAKIGHWVLGIPLNVHRLIANVVFGGAIVAAYASYRFLAAKTDEERAHYDWMGYVGNFIAISALIV